MHAVSVHLVVNREPHITINDCNASAFVICEIKNYLLTYLITTRLPTNLRPTSREGVHLVRRGHFRSPDEDGGHAILSAIAENPMLNANFTALSVKESELLLIEVLHAGIGIRIPLLHKSFSATDCTN